MADADAATLDEKPSPPVLPRLAELPEELISNISIKLGSDDIFALRLTSRALERKSRHEFASEYFHQKCIIITTDSLKVLSRIASSEKLRAYLHTLHIMPSLFSDRVFNCCKGPSCTWKPTVRQSEAWREYMRDQQELKRSGRDLAMLTETFQQLPALTNLEFVDSLASVPRHADLRGLSRSIRSTNNNPAHIPSKPSDGEYYRWKNHVWDVTMRALAASGKSTLLHLNTDLDQIKNSLSVSTNLNLGDETASGLATALKKVQFAGFYISSCKQSNLDNMDNDGIDRIQGAKHMAKLSGLLPSLAFLRLCFSFSPSSACLCNSFLSKTNLQKLRSLKLEKTFLAAKTFGPMILQMTAIEEIFFTKARTASLRLVEGTWRTILKVLQKLEKLEHLHLMWLEEQDKLAVFLKPLPHASIDDAMQHALGPMPLHPHTHNDLAYHGYDSDDDSEADGGNSSNHGHYDGDEFMTEDDEEGFADDQDEDPYNDEDSESQSEATDNSMPDLEPWDASASILPPASASAAPPPPPSQAAAALPSYVPIVGTAPPLDYAHNEDDAKGLGGGPHRGQKVCLHSTAQMKKYLPIFIDEYHCADEEEEAAAAVAAMAAADAAAANPFSVLHSMLPLGMLMGAGPPPGFPPAGPGVFAGPPPPPPAGFAGGQGAGQ